MSSGAGATAQRPRLRTMRRTDKDGLAVYRFETIPEDRVEAFVATRRGGLSRPPFGPLNLGFRVGDDPSDVVANRRRLLQAFDLSLEDSVWCRQVHRDAVTVVTAADRGRGAQGEEDIIADTDAMVTDEIGIPLCVTVADCVPVLIYDPVQHVIGVVHAGWAGTVRRISSATVRTMVERWGTRTADLIAAIGPSIAPEDYEVGSDVIEQAEAAYGPEAGKILPARQGDKAHFDLWTANALDLQRAGVPGSRIEIAGISTAANLDDFYSYRVEGETGRFIAAATLRPLAD